MSDVVKIAGVYQDFAHNGYSKLASNPEEYPLFTIFGDITKKYSVEDRGGTVLDIGCGTGLLKECTDYKHFSGIDISEDMLAEAANRGYSELIQASILDYLPHVADGSYDSVICFSMAYFLDEPELNQLISHVQRIAKKFWLITLDAIPKSLADGFYKETGVITYNHSQIAIPGEKERFQVEGWKSSVDGKRIGMVISVGGERT